MAADPNANLYYQDSYARNALSVTGNGTYNSTTGTFNVNNSSAALTWSATPVTLGANVTSSTAQAAKDNNFIYLKGTLSIGLALGNGSTILTLATGYRPPLARTTLAAGTTILNVGKTSLLSLATTGVMTNLQGALALNDTIYLDGLLFPLI